MNNFAFEMPAWLVAWERTLPRALGDDEAAMRVVISAAELNVRHGTGGPFGAAILNQETRALVAMGVNLVVSSKSSLLHAEIVAILRAQVQAGSHAVSAGMVLYSSAEPCAMCMGAIPWSGLQRVVCGASDADVRAIGFDEGDKPADWAGCYEKRGIHVRTGVLRDEATAVLRAYREAGGTLY